MKPVVSIVVPVYKGIRFLREALESVKAQTFADWECICVDDGSKDGSGALLDEIAATDARIVAVHQSNGGTSAARNAALSRVRGDYVMFLDEDDAYHPQMVETLLRVARETEADIVGCDYRAFAEDAHPVFDARPPDPSAWRIMDRDAIREAASRFDEGIPVSVWLNIYRAGLVRGHEFPLNVRIEQDMDWHYPLLPSVDRYVRIPFAGYAWRSSSIGGLNNPDAESMISWTRSFGMLFETVVPVLAFTLDQRTSFVRKVEYALTSQVWENLRRGVRLTDGQRHRLRDALRALLPFGVDLRHRMGPRLARRLQWWAFLRLGIWCKL